MAKAKKLARTGEVPKPPTKPQHMRPISESSSWLSFLVTGSISIAVVAIIVGFANGSSQDIVSRFTITEPESFIPRLEPISIATKARTRQQVAGDFNVTDEEIVKSTTHTGLQVARMNMNNGNLSLDKMERISLKGNDHLLIRLTLNGLGNPDQSSVSWYPGLSAPRSVVVKRFEPANFVPPRDLVKEEMLHSDSYRHATLDFLREARALELLNNTRGVSSPFGMAHHTFLAPLSYGSDLDTGTIAMQDLGGIGVPLYEAFGVFFRKAGSSDDDNDVKTKQSRQGSKAFDLGHTFSRIGEAFARLHSPEVVERAISEASIHTDQFSWLSEVSRYHDYDLFENSMKLLKNLFKQLGVDTNLQYEFEIAAISDSLLNPGPWLSMTHGDVCADNIFLMHKSARAPIVDNTSSGDVNTDRSEPMLIDYSSSGLRHRLADIATFHLLFPTCWCAGDIAGPFIDRLLRTYRHSLLARVRHLIALRQESGESTRSVQGEKMDLIQVERELADDTIFNRNLVQMAGFHLMVSLSEYWDDAYQNRKCGHVPCRAHVMTRLSAFLKLATTLNQLPGIVTATEFLYLHLRDELWRPPSSNPSLYSLPPFPVFARMTGSPRQSAAKTETRRLMAVSEPDALRWIKHIGPEIEIRQGRDSAGKPLPMSAVVQASERPLKVVNSPVTEWSALKDWGSLVTIAKQARPDMRWVIKKRGIESDGTFTRFPIGCCETIRVRASQLAGHQECLLNDCSDKLLLGLASPYYASVLISGNGAEEETTLTRSLGNLMPYLVDRRPDMEPIVNIWAASKGSITPLHYDPFHNTFIQVSGRKRFLLVPPSQWHSVYLHPRLHLRHRQAQLNLNDVDFDMFPSAKLLEGQVISVLVEPGEVLYVPPYWFHQVESVDNSISLSIFSDSVELDTLGSEWELSMPVDQLNSWNVEEVTSFVKVFLQLLLKAALPDTANAYRSTIESIVRSRYAPTLFADQLSAELQPEVPVAPSAQSQANGHVPDPHLAQYQVESKQVTSCLLGDPKLCNAKFGERAKLARQFCQAGQEFEDRHIPALAPHAASFAEKLVHLGGTSSDTANAKAIRNIILQNFVEDMVAKTVGEDSVFTFLRVCY